MGKERAGKINDGKECTKPNVQNEITEDTQNHTDKIERAIAHNESPDNIQGEEIQNPTTQDTAKERGGEEKEKEDSSDGINNR